MNKGTSIPNEKENFTRFFDRTFQQQIPYNTNEVDAVIGFFKKRGFDEVAAINTAVVLLQQAVLDDIPSFKLLDTLKGVTDVELSNIVAQILNFNRSKCSTIGFRVEPKEELFDRRNVIV
jgi:hypothetical protein